MGPRRLLLPLAISFGGWGRLNIGSSFNSSMEGKVCEKPVMSRLFIIGEDEGDDDGDGGPKVAGDTMVCWDEVDDIGVGGDRVDSNAKLADAFNDVERRLGDRGAGATFGKSREMRLTLMSKPLSCSARMRSCRLGRAGVAWLFSCLLGKTAAMSLVIESPKRLTAAVSPRF